jgi:hypothetical protein
MEGPSPRSVLLFAVLTITLVAARAGTNTLIVSRDMSGTFGSSSADPFFGTTGYAEQIYAAGQFTDAAADILVITEVAFRLDEAAGAMDVVFPRLRLDMSILRGPIEGGGQEPAATVYDREDVRLIGRGGELARFDVRFRLDQPFAYDRREGHLVLTIVSGFGAPAGNGAVLDADGSAGDFSKGAFIYLEPFGYPVARSVVLATEFSYKVMSASIEAVKRVDDTVQLYFTVSGNPTVIEIEGCPSAGGTYITENCTVTAPSPEWMRAVIPMTSKDRFFRIRLQ